MQKYLEKFMAIAARNKRVFVLALLLVILFAVFAPAHADAFAWIPIIIGGILLTEFFGVDVPGVSDIISGAAKPFLEALLIFVNIFVGMIAALLQGIYVGMGNLLHAVIKYLVAIPVVPGPEIGFVQEAWNFSLLFVNALFLLILVFIGLATILRLQSYQLQKTLPLLIVIALLVNFSGVLVGFVVDISNIITNFFLTASTNAAWWADPWFGDAPAAEKLGQNIARILYYPFGILLYFIVMLLFGVRVMILWTLTILAPLAFAALILPATKSLWTKWWSALIQWSIIGIPISFFLYLSGGAMNAQLPPATGGVASIVFIFAPLTALFLLFIGITLSMQMAPAGAQGVIDFGKKWGGKGGALAGRWAWGGVGGGLEKLGKNIRRRGEGEKPELNDLTRFEKSTIGKALGAGFGFMGKGPTGGAARFVTRWAGRTIEIGSGVISAQTAKKSADSFSEAQTKAQSRKAESNLAYLALEIVKPEFMRDKPKMAGTIAGMRARNDWDEIEDAVEKKHMFTWKHIGKNILVDAFSTLGSYGLRPMTLANAGRYVANPREHGFNADPIFDPENPGRVIGFTGPDTKWLTDHVLNDVPRRWEAATLKTNATPPKGSYQPFDIKINVDGTVGFVPNAQSSQAFEYAALFSGRTDVLNAILGLREGDRAQAAANLWRNVDPLSLVKGGAGRFLTWLTGTEARNIGVQTSIEQKSLTELLTAIETGKLTKDNREAQPGETAAVTANMQSVRDTYNQYKKESRDILTIFLQSSHSPDETDQILKLLGREGGTYSSPPGWTTPPGYTPGSPPPGWTRGTPLPPGWTWTPPPA